MATENKELEGKALLPNEPEIEEGSELILGDETLSERKKKESEFSEKKLCESEKS